MMQVRSNLRYLFPRLLPWLIVFLLWSMIFPSPALAFIPHWAPKEAFFIRQFSYLFFMVAMIFFIVELKLERSPQQRGFRLLIWASVFFALWNLDCFIGQWLALHFEAQVAPGPQGFFSQRLSMANLENWLNYFTRLDHLLLVPAFIFFYLGIREFMRQAQEGKR
ncbi:MAG: hypothetical protein WA433_05420 [Desulfobaccales bacterium]